MPISLVSIFIAILLINHIGLLRVAAADELGEHNLTHAPLCSGLLTSITLVVSMTLLALINPYLEMMPALRVLHHFVYLLMIAFIAHVLCSLCYKLKPVSIIPALFPIMLMNSIGLGVIILRINMGEISTLHTLIISGVFIITSTIFYYLHIWFAESNRTMNDQPLFLLLLIASIFALLLSVLITFH